MEVLKNNGSALDAVAVATMVLEDSPLTNAGYGSNLTWNGAVECDASIIDGSNMHYGGVGAVSGIKNPISLAKLICENQNLKMSFGRIPPWYIIINKSRLSYFLLLSFFKLKKVSYFFTTDHGMYLGQ